MSVLTLFHRLILRPMLREPGRTVLIIIAVAVGASVVLAINLASDAAAGSFKSSMESLVGKSDLEVTATGGVPNKVIGQLATLPYPIKISARIEDFATVVKTGETLPIIGLDMIAEASQNDDAPNTQVMNSTDMAENITALQRSECVWVTENLGLHNGESIQLLINDRRSGFKVCGVIPQSAKLGSGVIAMDMATAQQATGRNDTVTRILIKLPAGENFSSWRERLRAELPPGISINPEGTQSDANRKMLEAFRWNLHILSYVALLVGAFLIFNTISVSVVRRRPEIGTVRALGASRSAVMVAFLSEAAVLGVIGSICALPLGRLIASGAVRLLSLTVDALYISSTPGKLSFSIASVLNVFMVGVGVSLVSAFAPAREASLVPPTEAMARGRREHEVKMGRGRAAWYSLGLLLAAAICAVCPPVAGKPLFGYVSALLLVGSSAVGMTFIVYAITRAASATLHRVFGFEAMLACRGLSGSLRRTAVLVAALSTAIAMMISVAIMVGSFRQTLVMWMDKQLPADLYLRPGGSPGTDRHPTIAPDLVSKISDLPGVLAVTRFYAYEIEYQGLPITVASVDVNQPRSNRDAGFFSGRGSAEVLRELEQPDTVMASEPFINKHHCKIGDRLSIPIGENNVTVRIIDIFYDYGNEHGYLVMSRRNMERYLPDIPTANLAVYLKPGAAIESVRHEVLAAASSHDLIVMANGELRGYAVKTFDQTFTITYALEAISIMVAVLGIGGSLISIVIDRRREFGLMRFLGASSSQIMKLVLFEAGWIGILSSLTGLLLGYLLSLVLIYVINKQSFGWTIRFHWPFEVLFAAIGTVYLATVLAGLYPARLAQRLNPIEVVHEE